MMFMPLLPLQIDKTIPDTSFGQDIRAVEARLASARRWRRRRRMLVLRRLLTGRMRWRLPAVLAGRPPHRCAPAAVQ